MATPRTIYFPLRGNAYGALSGAPFDALRRRVKLASLLHDKVILHDGVWLGISGPGMNYQMHMPPGTFAPELARPQSARQRAGMVGARATLLTSDAPDTEPTLPIGNTETALHWRATFEPLRNELPHAYSWIEFENFTLHQGSEAIANQLAEELANDPLLLARYADPFTRGLVAKNATTGLVLGALMDAAVNLDRLHSDVMAALVARGTASPTLGHRALVAVIPDVRSLPWDQIDTARMLPGLPRLRAILAEVEEHASQGGNFDAEAIREFHNSYSSAVQEMQAGWRNVLRSTAIGSSLSLATLPIVGPMATAAGIALTAVVEAGRHLLGLRSRRNTWVAAADELTRMAADANAGEPTPRVA